MVGFYGKGVVTISLAVGVAVLKQANAQGPVSVSSLPQISAARDWIDWLALLISTVLMIVGIVGIGAALKTLRAVKKQADLMTEQAALMKEQTAISDKAASAALLNAQAVINAERPWLLIYPSRSGTGEHSSFTFKAVNRGRSPAEIINSGFRMLTPRVDEELPDKLNFGVGASPIAQWVNSRWLAPGEDFEADAYSLSYIVEASSDTTS